MDLLDRIGVAHPVVQAGMGGGVTSAKLAGAVSAAGALGTIGTLQVPMFAAQLADARERADWSRYVDAIGAAVSRGADVKWVD